MPQLTIADIQQKTTKSGKPYIAIKSSTGNFYTVWQEQEYIWHLLKIGETLDVMVSTNGKFTSITGVTGVEPPNASGGITVATNRPVATSGVPTAWDKIFEQMNRIEKKLDLILDNRIAQSMPPLDEQQIYKDTVEQMTKENSWKNPGN